MRLAPLPVRCRPHPRAEAGDAADAAEALLTGPASLHDFNVSALARLPSAEEAVPAADLVVSGFSTINTHAILWRAAALAPPALLQSAAGDNPSRAHAATRMRARGDAETRPDHSSPLFATGASPG